jgi:hypothetical protein
MTELLTVKELAQRLKRNPMYVYSMKWNGFKMPGMRATLEDALAWLNANPMPRARKGAHARIKAHKHV